MKFISYIFILFLSYAFVACNNESKSNSKPKENKEKLNIPETGIHSLMESNTEKIIEGTKGNIKIKIGEVTRKKADISIIRNDRIIEEKLLEKEDAVSFNYEGRVYTLLVMKVKKPLVGDGKVEFSIKEQ
ncbi:MAG TPA: hypothetical protein PKA54_08250 [Chitinophagaceae bacterium]|nr:MAG: hypothetical protein UZ11_BCD004001516 [Bacteroidetes bacterium OLB11]HMN33350.1 hypothetical protein [Chitinophagaceae bacterium]